MLAAPGGVDSLKNLTVAREVLRRVALGLGANASVELEPLCIYVRGMLVTHLPAVGGDSKSGAGADKQRKLAATATSAGAAAALDSSRSWAPVGTVLQPATETSVTSASGRSPLAHEFLAFGIGLLATALKRGRFSAADDTHLALLEPLLPLLQRAMRVDSDAVVTLALRTVGSLMSYPLPALPVHATALLERTLQILKRAANTRGTELVGIGVKVVVTLLRRPPSPGGVGPSGASDDAAVPGAENGAAKRKRDAGGATMASGEAVGNDYDDADDDDGEMLDHESEGKTEVGGATIGTADSVPRAPRVGGGAHLSDHQLRWLVTFVSVHLEDPALQSSLFGLLRVIFGRKFVLAELYDLVLTLGDMAIQADAIGTRHACSQLFLKFLLRYPLGPKRLQQHLNLLVTNLGYSVSYGRLSLLQLIHSLVAQLPLPVLHRQSDLLLLPLITRLVNDDNQECRIAIGSAITKLIQRTCDSHGDVECASARERLIKLLRAWYADVSSSLNRAAAQLAGLAVDALGATTLSSALVPLVVQCCEQAANFHTHSHTHGDVEAGGVGAQGSLVTNITEEDLEEKSIRWQPAYYSMRALLKLSAAQPKLLLSAACEPLWAPLHTLLLHEHAWVRSASSRLIGMLLAALQPAALLAAIEATEGGGPLEGNQADAGGADEQVAGVGVLNSDRGKRQFKKGKRGANGGFGAEAASISAGHGAAPPRFWCRRAALFELVDALLQQLHSALIAEAAAAQTLKNLLWISMAMVECPKLGADHCRAMLTGATPRSLLGGAFGGVDEKEEKVIWDDDADDDDDDADDAGDGDEGGKSATDGAVSTATDSDWACWPLEVVALRLVPLLQTPGHVRGCTAMRWYAAISTLLSVDQLNAMLPALLGPVARAADDASGKVHPSVKDLASEALQLLQRKADAPSFVAAYRKVKDAQRMARFARKEREALEAVADPARSAQKRVAKNLGKRKAKQRKLDSSKRARDSGGGIGLGSKHHKARRLKSGD